MPVRSLLPARPRGPARPPAVRVGRRLPPAVTAAVAALAAGVAVAVVPMGGSPPAPPPPPELSPASVGDPPSPPPSSPPSSPSASSGTGGIPAGDPCAGLAAALVDPDLDAEPGPRRGSSVGTDRPPAVTAALGLWQAARRQQDQAVNRVVAAGDAAAVLSLLADQTVSVEAALASAGAEIEPYVARGCPGG